MNVSVSQRLLALAASVLLGMDLPATIAAGSDGRSMPLPRYRLTVGQQITYHGASESLYRDPERGRTYPGASEVDWKVWVVRQNGDASWRLIIQSSQSRPVTARGGKRTSVRGDSTLAYCDLSAHGRIEPNPTLGYYLDPSHLFPPLPKDAGQVGKGWDSSVERDASIRHFKTTAEQTDGSGAWTFEETREGPMDRISLTKARADYTFGPAEGLIRRVASEKSREYGLSGKEAEVTELKGVEDLDPDWIERLARESEICFGASEAYHALQARAATDKSLLPRAEALLQQAREEVTLPALREQLDAQLARHRGMASFEAEAADARAQMLGKPAPDWEVKDLDGKARSLRDYRGKVVILDFWDRGCGWCIRAMPQLARVARDFEDDPVVVLGMNLDQDEANARFVVEQMEIRYPVLRAGGLSEKYAVRGIPSLVVIDQAGRVRAFHVGYSPTLREAVSESITRLLEGR